MELFETLGDDIDACWRARGYREELFPALAGAALRKHDLSSQINPIELLDRLLEAQSLPVQVPAAADFPVTLYCTERFSIVALFCVDSATEIHDHPSWGALQVLAGSSLQTRYEYAELERFTSYLSIGDLRIRDIEALDRGDVREIGLGREYIHAVCHLERPSVSVLVATRSPAHCAASFFYHYPGLAHIERFEEERLTRQLGALGIIQQTEPARYEATLARYVARSDAMYAFCALREAFPRLDDAAFDRVLEASRSTHGAVAEVWRQAFVERRRIQNLTERRGVVVDREHRFFLALLQSAPLPAEFLRLVSLRFPARDPIDSIMRWVRVLSNTSVPGPAGPTALGLELDEPALLVLDSILRGRDAESVLDVLRAEYELSDVDSRRGEVLELIDGFRTSLLFGSLFGLPGRSKSPEATGYPGIRAASERAAWLGSGRHSPLSS